MPSFQVTHLLFLEPISCLNQEDLVKLMTINVTKVVLLCDQGFDWLKVVTYPVFFTIFSILIFLLLFIFHTLRTLRVVFRDILSIPLITLFIFMFSHWTSISQPFLHYHLKEPFQIFFFPITPLPYEILIPQTRLYLFMCCMYICALSLIRVNSLFSPKNQFLSPSSTIIPVRVCIRPFRHDLIVQIMVQRLGYSWITQ